MIINQLYHPFESDRGLTNLRIFQNAIPIILFFIFALTYLTHLQISPKINHFIQNNNHNSLNAQSSNQIQNPIFNFNLYNSNNNEINTKNDTEINNKNDNEISNQTNLQNNNQINFSEPLITPEERSRLSTRDQQKLMNKRLASRFAIQVQIKNKGNLFETIKDQITQEPSAEYQNPSWFLKGYEKLSDFSQFSGSKDCPVCSFEPRNVNSDSTPRDAIIVSMLNLTYGFVPFVRSLRTTGCKATIVVFINNVAKKKIDESMQQFSKSCGVTFINIGSTTLDRNHFLLIRNPIIYDFLKLRPNLFDRILTVDVFDTIFQGDPFYTEFDRESIGFSVEDTRCNTGTIRNAGYVIDQARIFFQRLCVNIGTMLGTTRNVLYFLHHQIKFLKSISPDVMSKFDWIPDQVLFNIMINMNYTIKNKIPLKLYKKEDPFMVLTSIFKWKNLTWDLGNFRADPNGSYPLVVHLYDRNKVLCNSVLAKCPATFPTMDNYSRCGFKF